MRSRLMRVIGDQIRNQELGTRDMGLAKKIDHIAIAVKHLDSAVQTFTSNFGFPVTRRADVPSLGISLALLRIGDTELELFQPTTADNAPAGFLADRGEGMYALSLETENLDAALKALSAKGIRVGQVAPTADGKGRLAYVSPKATHGVLLQLIEHKKQ
jgi:methylmalonyl-CoA/ethylmalonyl-CoA epimerase